MSANSRWDLIQRLKSWNC